MELTNIDRRRLEHAARIIEESAGLFPNTQFGTNLRLAADKIRATLAPEIGDEPSGSIVELMDFHADLVEQSKDDDRKAAACLAAMEPFRVLGSCPAPTPQVDVIDREVT